MKRIGLIGTGRHGARYANHLQNDLEHASLTGISRRSAVGAEQAKAWGTSYFPDWRDLVADPAIEAVVAVAPPGQNLDIARCCAAYHKPLLMEKPLARNHGEAVQVVRVMREADCPLTVGQTLRYNPVIGALRLKLPEMGPLYSFTVNQRIEPSILSWHDEPEVAGAGVVIHTAVHVFDALRVIGGLVVKRVMAQGRCIHSRQLEDLVVMLVECENGVFGTVDVSKVGHARSGRFEFVCQDGQLVGEQIHGFLETVRAGQAVRLQEFAPYPTILPLLRDWLAFLGGKRENPVSGEDGCYAVAVCSAALRSAAERQWVDVESIDQPPVKAT